MILALEKIIASFFLPPGIFIVLNFVFLIYLFKNKSSRLIRLTAVFSLIFLIFLATAVGARVLVHPLENYAERNLVEVSQKYPIVVLGGGSNYYSAKKTTPSTHSLQRLVKGYELHRSLKTPLIYSGGVAIGQQNISEADAASEFLQDLGMDLKFYFSETKAQTTFENAEYLRKWIKQHQVKKVYLVTSAYHMLRSMTVFKAQQIEVLPVHSGFIYNHKLSWLDYFPSRGALNANLTALHEWIGLFWYYLKGRI